MSGIVQVRMWKDVGFLESSTEKPMIGAVLPSADYLTAEARYPSKADMFAGIEIKEDYITLMDMSYVEVTYDFNNSTPKIFYGWIDNISLKSDTDDYPLTRIDWHVDLWRTFNQQADFKEGFVAKAPTSPFPQDYKMIKWLSQSFLEAERLLIYDCPPGLLPTPIWWVFIQYTNESNDGHVTSNQIYCFPVSKTSHYYIKKPGRTTLRCISWADLLTGRWDEQMGLTPSRIKSCFLSPLPPDYVSGTGTEQLPFILINDFWNVRSEGDNKAGYFFISDATEDFGFTEFTQTLTTPVKTSDTEKFVITDYDGMPIGELPWGVEISSMKYRIVSSTTAMYIQFRLRDKNSLADSMCFSMPLTPLELTNNSWSEYNYTGQREYDIQMRNIQSMKSLVQGVVGGAAAGAIMGGMSYGSEVGEAGRTYREKMNRLDNQPSELVREILTKKYSSEISAVRGKALSGVLSSTGAGLAAGAAGSLINYGLQVGVFNPMIQSAKDNLEARKTDPLALAGGGFDTVINGPGCYLLKMTPDAPSLNKRNITIQQYGADVNQASPDCNSLIIAGGPMQIVNLNVCGDIPVVARQYMKQMFAGGVRLV